MVGTARRVRFNGISAAKRVSWLVAILLFVGLLSLTLVSSLGASTIVQSNTTVRSSAFAGHYATGQAYPFTLSYSGLPYDEQSGITFTQDFSSLTFNVTAIAQTGPSGNGPGYLLSALTDAGYWYQAGLSWKWPDTSGSSLPGFSMNYEVFNYFGRSIYPTDGGGGIADITVTPGDIVLLGLSFNSGNVVMQAYDWNTGSNATQTYNAVGASYFVGMPNSVSQNGFFTGLMTEQYYSTPYRGYGQRVVYSDSGFNYSSAWMWIDEFNTATNQEVFAAQTSQAVILNNTTPAYFSSNGTAEVASNHEFVTGLQPLQSVSFHLVSPAVSHPGQTATFNLTLQNNDQSTSRLRNLELVSDFGSYNVSSGLELASGATSQPITITVPAGVKSGSHGVTIQGTLQVYDPQLNAWISVGQVQTSTVLPVILNTAGPQRTTSNTGSSASIMRVLPEILAVLAGIVVLASIIATQTRRTRAARIREQQQLVQTTNYCSQCGQQVLGGMSYCHNCGAPLNSGIQSPTSGNSST